ncbi:MAG: YncE family protein [Actinomycetes bacterium]
MISGPPLHGWAVRALAVLGVLAISSCTSAGGPVSGSATGSLAATSTGTVTSPAPSGSEGSSSGGSTASGADGSAGLAPYAYTGAEDVSPAARQARPLVYVPNQRAGTVQVIDPATYTVISTSRVARSPEHVVPSHDMTTLWVNSDVGNALTPVDPLTGQLGKPVPVEDPYNLYFTPDGTEALVMAKRLRRIDVRDPATMELRRSVPVPCGGVNHGDFTADLATLLVSCEFSGQLLVLDADVTAVRQVIDLNPVATPGATSRMEAMHMGGPAGGLEPGATSMPQDVRLAPDGRHFLVADMLRNGVWVLTTGAGTGAEVAVERFVPTGRGAHGIYPSRDARQVYVSNRDEGSVSVLDAATLQVTGTWRLPGGGSPDMGGVTADGSQLWLSGRYDSTVYVIDTRSGELLHAIPVDAGPHGLLVWPQPGRYSLGHTGNMR